MIPPDTSGKSGPGKGYRQIRLYFVESICSYITKNCCSEEERRKIASLTGNTPEKLEIRENCFQAIQNWLCFAEFEKNDYVSGFLKKMDEFNLDDYIRAIHFDSFKIPKVPFQLPVSKHYYRLEEMREGELDFLKHTVLSRSMEPLHLCSDMAGGGYGGRCCICQEIYVGTCAGFEKRA